MIPTSWWVTFWTAMTPLGELRIAIPLAIGLYKLNPWLALGLSFIGNATGVVLLYFLLEPVTQVLRKLGRPVDRFFTWLFAHTYHRHAASFDRYGSLALAIFVAIPLPLTGGWAGALAAYVFGIKWRYAIPSLLLGILGAGIIVTMLTMGGVWVFSL